MVKKVHDCYIDKISIIGWIIEACYIFSMTVFIFISHETEGFLHTHTFKLFASLFVFFGLWHFSVKKSSFKKMLSDILLKTVALFAAIVVIGELTGVIKTTGLYSALFYPTTLLLMFWLKNRKSNWPGFSEKLSASEYREKKFGLNAKVIPDVLWFIVILIAGVLNVSTILYVLLLLLSFGVEIIFVAFYSHKQKMNKIRYE
ncbi:hypothetical protein J7E78_25855 [Paenibacillus polymyxa]|uniref:hypothetical protein n=1 Tax=Paenibacillus polymyxa TaxID=1406 RepID=UPI001BE61B16|nr:hypothetical protein [Paenibacillus polymyxa]MBT2286949.1 hypothetical protein [Paenibacillus polymyxa]